MKHEHAAALIPDHAMGRLDDESKRAVDLHLEGCESCRALFAEARELRRVLRAEPYEKLLEHVQSAHLTRYALSPLALSTGLKSWIEEHLSHCDVCREAVEILRGADPAARSRTTPPAPREDSEPRRNPPGAWEWLTRTVLRPVPAFAYLFLLVAVAGGWWFTASVPRSPGAPVGAGLELLPPPVVVYAPDRFRSEGGDEDESTEIAISGLRDLYLQIHTDIDDDLLENEAATFRLRVSRDGETVLARTLTRSELSEFGVLQLRIGRDALVLGRDYRIEIRLDLPGSPGHDEVLFRRDLRFLAE